MNKFLPLTDKKDMQLAKSLLQDLARRNGKMKKLGDGHVSAMNKMLSADMVRGSLTDPVGKLYAVHALSLTSDIDKIRFKITPKGNKFLSCKL